MPARPAKDKPLFTPGPLTTSRSIKQAMLRDLGSRDTEFIETIGRIRTGLLQVAGVSREEGFEVIPIQGSGTFAIEGVLSSAIEPGGKLLVIINGAYGERIAKIARLHGIETRILRYPENQPPPIEDIKSALEGDPSITMVSVVHCETSSGIMNPIEEIGQVVRRFNKTYFVDSMSAFGAVPFDFKKCEIDYLVSSSNKCIEGVPGFAYAICRREVLLASEGWAGTVSLDLLDQWRGLEKNGQFRFTPPTHAMLAFDQALRELEEEGGVLGRAARYRANYEALAAGMQALGFKEYVAAEHRGYIITAFHYPEHPNFSFEQFYRLLNERGFVIYPGKVTDAECFRIGNIGRIFRSDVQMLLSAIREVIAEMGVELRARDVLAAS